ncbi:hypothetical protein MP228_001549 [Amoeboaphelidium protococcarum]|nr:hypothetical protein MP228_001549 [Amoeboaphelidium protococcarum]
MDGLQKKISELQLQVEQQGALVKQQKAQGKAKDEIQPDIAKLISLKAELSKLEDQLPKSQKFNRAALEEVLRKRFFYGQSFSPYGGISGLYDYGPVVCALQNNVVDLWRKHFVLEEDMLEVDCTILTPHDVLKTSGHVDRFADLMCKDLKTGEIYRVDHLVENELEHRLEHDELLKKGQKLPKKDMKVEPLSQAQVEEIKSILAQIDGFNMQELKDIIKKFDIKSPQGNEVSEPEIFNLMFGTSIGATGQFPGFLRPETAQGQFCNFKRLLEFNNDQMPFASASIGKSFRNEISPRSGLLRVREFLMAEIEHFVHPQKKQHPKFDTMKDVVLNLLPESVQMQGKTEIVRMKLGEAVSTGLIDNQTIGYFMARIHLFLEKIGVDLQRVRFRQHLRNEMAHYAVACWDAEIHNSYGWIECVGCADRSAYDLTKHTERTKEKLVAREQLEKPMVVEKLSLILNKKLFGPAFKKDAKLVESALNALGESELAQLKKQLDAGDNVSVKYEQDQTATITPQMVQIEQIKETVHVLEYTPNVIEPSFGIGRILYSLLEHSWYVREGDDQRNVFKFPAVVAPTKCLVLPISNNAEFHPALQQVTKKLNRLGVSNKIDNSSGAIGRRYARNDELGTSFGITIDFQTVSDGSVTLRERDSMSQVRGSVDEICEAVRDLCQDVSNWSDIVKKFPAFTKQDADH